METLDRRPADAASSLAERLLPQSLWPYARLARLDRPVGWQLLLIPCLWSEALAALAQNRVPSVWHILLFTIGAIAMRGAGSTWNDVLDRDIDRQVERTRNRPLANGSVTLRQALIFMMIQALVGFLVLIQFNLFTIVLGIASLLLVALYPLAKRVTGHPQIVLGLVFGWGALVGWAAAFGALAQPALLLYAATVFWIIGYDTIYAMQDIEDDAMVGIGSTALTYGKNAFAIVSICYGLTVIFAVLAIGAASRNGWLMAAPVGTVLGTGLALQIYVLHKKGVPAPGPVALNLFKSNAILGAVIALLLMLSSVALNTIKP
jgi:4-hydroxybenzoate polyprenyltransferase